MQLIQRSSGNRFDMPANISLSIELNNPYFNQSGSYSLPISLPDTYNNRNLFGYANRLDVAMQDASDKWTRKINISQEIQLIQGSWQQIGTLLLLSYSQGGFECSILLGESTIWEKLKNVTLKDVMKDIVWHPQSGRTTKNNASTPSITNLIDALEQRISGTANVDDDEEDFVVFPLFVDKVGILNHVTAWQNVRFYHQNFFTINDQYVHFERTSGIGFTAFLHLTTILELIFLYIGRELTIQYPDTIDDVSFESVFKKIVILNSTIDACAPGLLFYDTLVPDMEVLDFLQNMFAMFSAGFFETSTSEVKMCFMKDTIDTRSPNTIDAIISNIEYADDTYLQLAFNHLRSEDDKDITDISTLETAYIIPDELKTDKDPARAQNAVNDQPISPRRDAQIGELVRLHDRGEICYSDEAPGSEFYSLAFYDQLDIVAPKGTQTEDIENTISDTHLANVFDFLMQTYYFNGSQLLWQFLYAYDIYTPQLAALNSETTTLKVTTTTQDNEGNTSETQTEITQLKDQPLVFCYHGGIKQFYFYDKDEEDPSMRESFILSSYGTPFYVFDTDLADHAALDLTTQGMPRTMHSAYQRALHEGMHTVTCRAQMTISQVFELDFSKPLIIHSRKYIIQTIRLTVANKPLQEIELILKAV